jgi:ubiquinone/menaquinone biosynthesis methyltransferase
MRRSFFIMQPHRLVRCKALHPQSRILSNASSSPFVIQNAALLSRSTTTTASSSSRSNNNNNNKPYVDGAETHFGFTNVAVTEKEAKVRHVFEKVADSYDVMNDLMSGGLHRLWKDHLLKVSAVESIAKLVRRQEAMMLGTNVRPFRILDVAGGTGDVAFRFVDAADCVERAKSSGVDPIQVVVCDINAEMLRVGQARALDRYGRAVLEESQALVFEQGNAQDLHPNFPESSSFDLYTIAFGLRNVTDVDMALREAYRVLKPGGRFLCLEFSHVPNDLFRTIYDAYSMHAIPLMGHYVAGDRDSYQYLVESIRKFPPQDELVARIANAGFREVKYVNMTGGIVALHEGWKL